MKVVGYLVDDKHVNVGELQEHLRVYGGESLELIFEKGAV